MGICGGLIQDEQRRNEEYQSWIADAIGMVILRLHTLLGTIPLVHILPALSTRILDHQVTGSTPFTGGVMLEDCFHVFICPQTNVDSPPQRLLTPQ
jgi:hypothetical protein